LKEEALDRTQWRTRFGRGYGPVVRQTAGWNECETSQNFAILPWILIFCIYKHLTMIGLIETCSVWDNNNKYRLCQTEYTVLFMQHKICFK
jgi:hypothetical protein